MLNISYVDPFNQEVSFDKHGDPPAWLITIIHSIYNRIFRYDILNYIGKKGFRYAADFRRDRAGRHILNMTTEPIMFYDKSSRIPESVCSKPCGKGQRVN